MKITDIRNITNDILTNFKRDLLEKSDEEIVKKYILENNCLHINSEDINYIRNNIAFSFSIPVDDISLCVAGSAKLGFSLFEKKTNGIIKPRYRFFSAESDIDIAIISPILYKRFWDDLSIYSCNHSFFPWNSCKFGDYFVCGWIRPDKLPNIKKKDIWWDCFNNISVKRFKGIRQIRGALYFDNNFFIEYQKRSIRLCKSMESDVI